MSDKKTINNRSKIKKTFKIFFIVFITLTLSFLAVLRYGITIDSIDVPYVKLKELYIKWDKKLVISIQNAQILNNSTKTREQPDIKPKKILQTITNFCYLFQRITIKNFHYKDIQLSMMYSNTQDGYIHLQTKNMFLNGSIYIDDNNIYLTIKSLKYFPLKTHINGYILFDKSNKLLETSLHTNIINEAYFTLYATLQDNKIIYKTTFHKPIQHPKKIIKLIPLPKAVEYWVDDAIKAKDLTISQLYGNVDFDHLENALTSLYIQAKANKLSYTYHPKIAPVKTDYTLLEFKKGIFYIKPQHPTTYGYDLQKSYLQIDFSKPQEILTLYLIIDKAKLDKNILHILSTYHINVPLLQNSGTTKANLTLTVNLRTIQVDADGIFYVKQGNFHYLDFDIDVANTKVLLHNTHIQVKQMDASLANNINAKVDIDLYLAQQKGTLNFYLTKLSYPTYHLQLKKPIKISYKINPTKQDTIRVPKGYWKVKNKTYITYPITLPFNFKASQLSIPKLTIKSHHDNLFYLKGICYLKQQKFKFSFNIAKFHYNKLVTKQSNIPLFINASAKKIVIQSPKTIHFNYNNTPLTLKKFIVEIKKNILKIDSLRINIEDLLQANIATYYNLNTKKGTISLLNAKLQQDGFATLFETNKKLNFTINNTKDLKISNENLQIYYISNAKHNLLELGSLQQLIKYSSLLKKYKIKDGFIKIDNNQFQGSLISDYKLLMYNNKKINSYQFQGKIQKEKTTITLNKMINITLTNKMEVSASKVGLDIVELERLIDDLSIYQQKNKEEKKVFVTLKQSYLYLSKTRKILYDTLIFKSQNGHIDATLTYKNAEATFKYFQEKFVLKGKNFNDTFMDNLFLQSKFKGGRLDFDMYGSFDNFYGIVEIKNTTILDYKILNNILAFIDTVPSLVTFSLPKYSQEGLDVSLAYASFHYIDGVFEFDNISLDSDQIDILGKGKASYTQNFIDLILQLKTTLAENVSKVPVVGYILFDGKSLSTSLKVQGSLTNPKVELTLAKDIIVAPLNIIKRTVLYPFHLFGLDEK